MLSFVNVANVFHTALLIVQVAKEHTCPDVPALVMHVQHIMVKGSDGELPNSTALGGN